MPRSEHRPGSTGPTGPEPDPETAFSDHDHAACIRRSLDEIEALDAANVLRLTPMRRRVLEILLESHTALGAYEILRRLGQAGAAQQPPVVYRALDFLMRHGFAHRIERLNAYVACSRPERCAAEDTDPAFLICRRCHAVSESRTVRAASELRPAAERAGFRLERVMVEAIGVCADCVAVENGPGG